MPIALPLVALVALAPAQTPRPKVALALSGGGAYGLIYLGALEWLEEHRIPVDAIAGTSGGALVGGWYATGLELLSDEEILYPRPAKTEWDLRLNGVAPVLEKIDFEHLFDSQPDYRNLGMPVKRERRLYPNDFFGGIARGRQLRRDGLVPGQTVGYFLDWIGRDYPLAFENLPTPFRAVAVDASSANPPQWRTVTLGGPNPEIPLGLARAIRASISVPILFAPVEASGHRLIDGAVRNNLPTDVAIDAFNPDVLIGLRFDSGYGPDPYHAGRGGKEPREKILVTFDPGKNRVDQFARWRAFAWLGYRQMDELQGPQRAALDALSLSPADYLAYRKRRRAPRFDHVPTSVTGDTDHLDEVRRAVVGKDLDDVRVTQALGAALDRLVANEDLATAGYDLRHENGETTLYVRTTRPKGGPPFLRTGWELESNSGDRPWYGFRQRVSDLRKDGISYWGDLTIGNEPNLFGGMDIPVGRNLSVSPTGRLNRDVQFDFRDGSRSSEVAISTAEAQLALVYRPSRNREFSLGALAGSNGATDQHGNVIDRQTGAYRGVVLRAETDTTDDPVVPRKGTRAWLEARNTFGLDHALAQSSGSAETYFGTLHDAWGLHARFGTSFGADAPFPFEYRLGGLDSLDAYRRDEVRDDGFWSLGLSQTHALSPLPFAFGRLFAVTRFENAWALGKCFPSLSAGIRADTRAGAGYLGLGFADRGAVRLLIGLGRRF